MVVVFPGQKILSSHVNEKLVKTGDTATGTIIFPNQRFTPTDTEPTAVKGALYYDDSESTLKHYNGSTWVALGAGGGPNMFQQAFVNQTVVTVNHNLGNAWPAVEVYDSGGNIIEPVDVDSIDTNNTQITFGSLTSGTAVIIGGGLTSIILGTKRYSESFIAVTTLTVAHNLNSTSPNITVWDTVANEIIYPDAVYLGPNTIRIDFAVATTGIVEIQGGTQTTAPGAGAGDFLPNANNTWDIGSGTFKWKDGYFAGKLYVAGGIDPTYIQFTTGTDPGLNNSIWLDTVGTKLKFRDNAGVSKELLTTASGALLNTKNYEGEFLFSASGASRRRVYFHIQDITQLNSMTLWLRGHQARLGIAGGMGGAFGHAHSYSDPSHYHTTRYDATSQSSGNSITSITIQQTGTYISSELNVPKFTKIRIDGTDYTITIGDPNSKGPTMFSAGNGWGVNGTTEWDSGRLNLLPLKVWTNGEHYIEFVEAGLIGGRVLWNLYINCDS